MTTTTSTEPKVPAPRGGSADAADGRERVSAFWSLSRAMLLGMKRDRTATFFILLFPLVFLVFFGSVTKGSSTPHAKVAQVGAVKLFDSMTGEGRTELDKVLTITRTDDEAGTLEKVRKGDFDAMITQGADGKVELRYTAADQVRAGALQGIFNSVVQEANQQATHQAPAYVVDAQQVEDKSLKPIQFLTPGLLGWAVATGAVFGAALTLVNWRKTKVLRRLRLAPISAGTVVSSRILVSLLTAFLQTGVFLVVATSFFGLKLTGNWWPARRSPSCRSACWPARSPGPRRRRTASLRSSCCRCPSCPARSSRWTVPRAGSRPSPRSCRCTTWSTPPSRS